MARGNSLYAKLTRDLIPQYCKRIISDDETIQMLLSMLYQHTGIDYGNKTKAYREGYEVGCVETRRAYEGKRYTEAEMDKHGQLKYQEGYKAGTAVRQGELIEELYEAVGTITASQWNKNIKQATIAGQDIYLEKDIDAACDKGYLKGCQEAEEKCAAQRQLRYQQGFEEGRKVEHDHAFSLGENAGYERRKKHVQVSEEHFYAKGHNEGYQKGKAEGVAIGIKVKDEALNEYRKDGHNEGYLKGIEDGTKGKEKFANDRAEESYKKGHSQGIKDAWQKFDQGATWEDGYQQGKRDADAKHQVLTAKAERQAHDAGFADGYAKGKQQGKKEVVDFINNMKVSQ